MKLHTIFYCIGITLSISLHAMQTSEEQTQSHNVDQWHLESQQNVPFVPEDEKLQRLQEKYNSSDRIFAIEVIDQNTVALGFHLDQDIHIRNLQTNQTIQRLKGHTDTVLALELVNEHTLASAAQDKTIRLWDLTTCQQIKEFKGGSTQSLKIIDQNTLASASTAHSVSFWNIGTGERIKYIDLHKRFFGSPQQSVSCIFGLALLTQDKIAVTFAERENTGMIRIIDLNSNQTTKKLIGHDNEAVQTLAAINENTLLSGDNNGAIRIWDLESEQCRQVLKGSNKGWITALAAFNNHRFISGSGNTLCTWKQTPLVRHAQEVKEPNKRSWNEEPSTSKRQRIK